MGQPDFGRSTAPPIPHHLHDDGDAVDGDAIEGIHHGLSVECEPADPLGFILESTFIMGE